MIREGKVALERDPLRKTSEGWVFILLKERSSGVTRLCRSKPQIRLCQVKATLVSDQAIGTIWIIVLRHSRLSSPAEKEGGFSGLGGARVSGRRNR